MKTIVLALMIAGGILGGAGAAESGIQPYRENPQYWEYRGKPVMLLGASEWDNLFQMAGDVARLQKHLDNLKESGVNYVRCTMSSRSYPRSGEQNARKYSWTEHPYPFLRLPDGRYDLDRWNEEYWQRLEIFLRETGQREIIVQLEIWDAWNQDGSANPDERWNVDPWNPDNNVNYTYENTVCEREYKHSSGPFTFINNPFFRAVPALSNDPLLLKYQQRYVGHIVDTCMPYDHVLFQIDNESPLDQRIGEYWAVFIRDHAKVQHGKTVYVADSRRFRYPALDSRRGEYPYKAFRDWNNPEISHPITARYGDDVLFNYCDIAQNQGNMGQDHYDNILWYRQQLARHKVRPLNNVKSYWWKWVTGQPDMELNTTYEEKVAKFWRAIFAGCASIRYHRLWSDEPWQRSVVKSARMFVDEADVFQMEPDNSLLSNRTENEAYCLAHTGEQYAVYFTGENGNSVELDVTPAQGGLGVRWLDIAKSAWTEEEHVQGGGRLTLTTPGSGPWAVHVRSNDKGK